VTGFCVHGGGPSGSLRGEGISLSACWPAELKDSAPRTGL
jgi:hypothetical protein